MGKNTEDRINTNSMTRRCFMRNVGGGALGVAGAFVCRPTVGDEGTGSSEPRTGQVRKRKLGRTGLTVSEVGFGGHSWSYRRVPDGNGMRLVSEDEALKMIQDALEMGVNYFDACTPPREHELPGKVLKKINRRKDVYICLRLCHKMKGRESDKKEINKFIDERLKLWRTDYADIMMVSMVTEDYWDMSYAIEALDKLKQQGKTRFSGFGSHFSPTKYVEAIEKYGNHFDICSMPYNVRHRAAEQVFPAAEKSGLGIVTIKPFARGSLLKSKDLQGKDKGLPRKMVAAVLESRYVDVCIPGVHTIEHVRENFGASWTRLSDRDRSSLGRYAARSTDACEDEGWLERGWLHV